MPICTQNLYRCEGIAEATGDAVLADPFDLVMGPGADAEGIARGQARSPLSDEDHRVGASQYRCNMSVFFCAVAGLLC